MAFMRPEVTGKKDWVGIETTAGFWWVPLDVLSPTEAAAAKRGAFESLLKYAESGTRVLNHMSGIKKGYGVRLSAPGYMDSTEWEFYTNKAEAQRRAKELARDAEGDDEGGEAHATVKRTGVRKSPKQLDREIAGAIKRPRGRAHSTMQRGSYPFDLVPGDVVVRRDIKGRKKYRVSHLGKNDTFVYTREVGSGSGNIITFLREQLRLAN